MIFGKEYKNNISLNEKILLLKEIFLRILTIPARKKFLFSKQISILCKRFYDEYNDADIVIICSNCDYDFKKGTIELKRYLENINLSFLDKV